MYNNTKLTLQNIPIRPLNKGMIRNVPSTMMPDGSFLRLQNYRVDSHGLTRRGAYRPLTGNSGTNYKTTYNEKLYGMIYYWAAIANPEMLIIGSDHIYKFDVNGDTDTLYPDITTPTETSYPIVSASPYNTELQTTEVEITMTPAEYNAAYIGDDFFYFTSTTEHFLGTIIGKVYGSTTGTFTVETPLQGTGEVIYRLPYVLPFVLTSPPLPGDNVYIRDRFSNDPKMNTNYTILPPESYGDSGQLIVADQSGRGIYSYSNSNFKTFVTESSVSGDPLDPQYFDSAGIVCYMNDRLFVGNTVERGKLFGQRIRWSDPVNFSRFQPLNYIDLPYSRGKLLNLVPLGPLLVAYFEDTVYLGRASNNKNMPFEFERLETGSSGLVSQHAVVSWDDSHYFVSRDDIYKLSISGGLESIKSPVLEETLYNSRDLLLTNDIQIEHDSEHGDIVFLFPTETGSSLPITGVTTRLWRYNYLTKSWAYDEVNFADTEKTIPNFYFTGLLASKFYLASSTWSEWMDGSNPILEPPVQSLPLPEGTTAWWMPLTANPADPFNPDNDVADLSRKNTFFSVESWESLKGESLKNFKLYPTIYTNDKKQIIAEEFEDIETDHFGEYTSENLPVNYPIWSVLEFGDMDFGAVDSEKTVTRISLKTFNNDLRELDDRNKIQSTILQFSVLSSDRMGYRWKRPSILRIHKDYNEGHADFRVTGSAIRFKIINNQEVPAYKISEFGLRVALKGKQVTN